MLRRAASPPHRYRADLDGLRALAVLAVVLYHAVPGALRGGFVGVDVFFVISGYLITGILARANDTGTFRFSEFFARRARRIFPALVLVLIATVALGALVLPALANERLGAHVLAGAFFSSNLLLWHEAGYFDAASSTKPLLHLWSLGIEEQFYLVWPSVMLLLSMPRVRRHRLTITTLIACASFAYGVLLIRHDATADFYSPLTRAWELMLGAILALAPLGARAATERDMWMRWRDALAIAGALLVLASAACFTARMPFPGWYALFPVVGATMLIGAGPDAWFNRRVLSHPIAVSVGRVSYPLYLWHWPLLVMTRQIAGVGAETPLSLGVALIVVGVSIAAAYGTYRVLELPLRRPEPIAVAWRATFALVAVGALGGLMTISRGDVDRDTQIARQARNDWTTPTTDSVYFVSDSHRDPLIVFVGDSHVEQYYPSVKHAVDSGVTTATVAFSTHRGCPFLPGIRSGVCDGSYQRGMRVASLPSVRRVVIASAWDMYGSNDEYGEHARLDTSAMRAAFDSLSVDVARLRALGKDVVLIGPHPHAESADPELLAAHRRLGAFGTTAPTSFAASFPLSAFREHTRAVNENLARLAATTGATLIDPATVLCPAEQCITTDDRGTPLRTDSNHLRPFAAVRYLTYVPALLSLPGSSLATPRTAGTHPRATPSPSAAARTPAPHTRCIPCPGSHA